MIIAVTACSAGEKKDEKHREDRRDRTDRIEESEEETRMSAANPPADDINCISVDDWETGEYFIIHLDLGTITINSNGYALEPEQVAEISAYMENYNDIVRDGRDDYWPDTSEPRDMDLLFSYEIEGSTIEPFSGY